jgi:hypothetical protein
MDREKRHMLKIKGKTMGYTNTYIRYAAMLVISTAVLLGALFALQPTPTHAQSGGAGCSTLSDAKGRADYTASGVAEGTYTIWSRVKASSGTTAGYTLSIDGDSASLCDQDVSTSVSGTDWVWVKQGTTFDWPGGDMRFQMAGTIDGVGLDCVVLRTDNADLTNSGKDGCDENYGGGGDTASGGTPGGATSGGCGTVVNYDVNGNGAVTSGDAFEAYANIDKTDQASLCKYDVNRNGAITSGDAFQIYANID